MTSHVLNLNHNQWELLKQLVIFELGLNEPKKDELTDDYIDLIEQLELDVEELCLQYQN